MVKPILFLLLFIWSFPTMAQKVVDSKQTEERNGLVHIKGENIPFTGTVVSLFPAGNKQIETLYLNGKQNGLETAWFTDGKVMMEIN